MHAANPPPPSPPPFFRFFRANFQLCQLRDLFRNIVYWTNPCFGPEAGYLHEGTSQPPRCMPPPPPTVQDSASPDTVRLNRPKSSGPVDLTIGPLDFYAAANIIDFKSKCKWSPIAIANQPVLCRHPNLLLSTLS
jgi:hypothetical protein